MKKNLPKKALKVIEPSTAEIVEFLNHSNYIEGVYGAVALKDAMESWNYIRSKKHITDVELLEVHRLLAANLNHRIAGKLRDCSVWVGGEKKQFIDADLLLYQLRTVLAGVAASFGLKGNRERIARDCHVMFEDVHPFEDFNGRTGRILYNWHRLELGLPIHIIHEGDEQLAYYRWFRGK